MEYGLGVDLGTTHTAAAEWVGGHVEVVRLGGRRSEIPSLVFIGADGTVLIGEAAERRGAAEPARLAREFKRRVGDPVPNLVGGSPYSAHALMARLLHEVLAVVTARRQAPPAWVTVTHPANWGPYKRELIAQAVRLAEVEHATLRVEPEAAAVRYAAGERVRPGETVAVYDLGGGTFDAAVLRKTDSGFAVLGESEGIEQLGGIDFDEAVFAHVLATLGDAASGLDPDDEEVTAAIARLRQDCREAKEALSFDTEAMIPVALPGMHTRVRLNRTEFEAMITPALAETVAALRRALRSAGIDTTDLRSVVLAGGSSRIPLVAQTVAAEFGRPVFLDPDPEHSIALGAAILAAPAVDPRPAAENRPAEHPGPPPETVTVSPAGTAPVTPAGTAPVAPTGTPPGTPATPTGRGPARSAPDWRRRRRRIAMVAVPVVALLAVTGVAWALSGSPPSSPPADPDRPVPTVVGLNSADADAAIRAAGFVPKPIAVPRDDSCAKGSVTGQAPGADRAQPAGTEVSFTVCGGADQVAVPDLTGRTEAGARRAIKDAALKGRAAPADRDGDCAAGKVFRQEPAAGEPVEENSTVTYTLCGDRTVTVPVLRGKDRDAAEAALREAGLYARFQLTDNGAPQGQVVGSDPGAGRTARDGATVVVYLSRGNLVAVPAVLGLDQAGARNALEAAGFRAYFTTEETAEAPPGTAFRQNPRAGAWARKYSTVTVTLATETPPSLPPDGAGDTDG